MQLKTGVGYPVILLTENFLLSTMCKLTHQNNNLDIICLVDYNIHISFCFNEQQTFYRYSRL